MGQGRTLGVVALCSVMRGVSCVVLMVGCWWQPMAQQSENSAAKVNAKKENSRLGIKKEDS